MSDTGIVRRVDDLGRIVIPMELRRTLGINVKDPIVDLRRRRAHHPGEVSATSCAICGSEDDVQMVKDRAVCATCVADDQEALGAGSSAPTRPAARPLVVHVVARHAALLRRPRGPRPSSGRPAPPRARASAAASAICAGSSSAAPLVLPRPGGADEQDDLTLELAPRAALRPASPTSPRATSSCSFVSSRAIAALAARRTTSATRRQRRGGAPRRLVEDERGVERARASRAPRRARRPCAAGSRRSRRRASAARSRRAR